MESNSDSKVYSVDSSPLDVRDGGVIEHTVSQFDTLAGVAIKYGVEVSDVKRMNGLTNDLQMFGRKLLKIPLPGRHPPSPVMSNGYHTQGESSSKMTPPNHRYTDSYTPIKSLKLSSPQRNISSSINSLRDYYGLPQNDRKSISQGYEMIQNNSLLGHHRKSKSEANRISEKDSVNILTANDKSIEKLVRRRKSEVDLNIHTPEDLALQAKIVKHITTESESFPPNMIPLGSRDSSSRQSLGGVRKSSSAPVFLQSETTIDNSSPAASSFWPISMLNFTADLQAMSIAAIASPLFDGLPKPTSGRKNKAARD